MHKVIKGEDKYDDLKYILYSIHDTQISNVLVFMDYDDFFYRAVPFSSNMYFETYKEKSCYEKAESENEKEDCIKVR